MKRKLFTITVAIACTTAMLTSVTANAVSGDANGDGSVNVRDCAYIASALAKGNADILTEDADFNGDGKVNVRDAAALANNLALNNQNIFDSIPSEYVFASGAGGWSTYLTLNLDGSFIGSFHDSNMGENGEGYNATIYVCDFEGSFSQPGKIDDYRYSMNLETLTQEGVEGESVIEDKVKYITSFPYGIVGGDEFIIYMPGCPAELIDNGFKVWAAGAFSINIDNEGKLPEGYYGIYNVAQKLGFVGKMN